MDFFKDLLWDHVVERALAKVFLKIPLLGWGPIGQVIMFFAKKFSSIIYEGLKEFIAVEKITLKNAKLAKEFHLASTELKVAANSFGIDSREFKNARENNKKRLADFVRFDVARSLQKSEG